MKKVSKTTTTMLHPNDSQLSGNVCDAIKIHLTKYQIDCQWIDHEPVYTMDQAAKVCGHPPEQGVKVLLVMAKNDARSIPVLVVWVGNKKVSFESLALQTGFTNISMASPSEVYEYLGIDIGALSPFGYTTALPVYFHQELLEQPKLYINPGLHNATVELSSKDLYQLIEAWSSKVTLVTG